LEAGHWSLDLEFRLQLQSSKSFWDLEFRLQLQSSKTENQALAPAIQNCLGFGTTAAVGGQESY